MDGQHFEKNDHDLLITIDTRLDVLIKAHTDFKTTLDTVSRDKMEKSDAESKFKDHENRMRKMERIIYIGLGALAILELILK